MSPSEPERIVITGASSGIGRDLAIQMAAAGKELWLVGRDSKRLNEVALAVESKGATANQVILDLNDLEACERFLGGRLVAAGRVDCLYFVAGISIFGEVKDLPPEDWGRVYKTDLLAAAQWTAEIYKSMVANGCGRIVLVSSLAGYAGYPTSVPYAAMKAGMLGLYRTLSHEGRPYGVTVHIASPGYVETGIFKSAIYRGSSLEKTMRLIKSLGFGLISSAEAASAILRRVKRGSTEFAFPWYASLMAWTAQRFPIVTRPIHAIILKRFRNP